MQFTATISNETSLINSTAPKKWPLFFKGRSMAKAAGLYTDTV